MADETVSTGSASEAKPTSAPVAKPPSTQQLIDQYDLGDTVEIPSYEAVQPSSTPAESPTPAPDSPRPLPARGPDGKFLPAETASPAAEPVAERPQHNSRLVQMAVDYGIPDAEINEMSPAELERSVFHMHRLTQNIRRDNDRQQILQQATEPKVDQNLIAREPDTQTPHDPGIDEELGFDPSEYDQNLVGALKRLAKENKELRSQVGHLYKKEQFRESVETGNIVDRHFFKLNAQFGDIFGNRPITELQCGDPEGERRVAVMDAAKRLKRLPHETPFDVITRAADILYGHAKKAPPPRSEPPARSNGRIEEADWEAARLARPTHRGGASEPKERGYDAAVKGVARALQDMEASGDTSGDTSLDGFPD